jgi:hypothetical protein
MDEGYVTDLSLQGCAIETQRILMPDEYIQLHLMLRPKGLRITVGKVRWSRHTTMDGFNQHGRVSEHPLFPSFVRPTSRRKRMSALWQTALGNY